MTTTPPRPEPHKRERPKGIDWNAIFRARPDLEPPGYRETTERMVNRSER